MTDFERVKLIIENPGCPTPLGHIEIPITDVGSDGGSYSGQDALRIVNYSAKPTLQWKADRYDDRHDFCEAHIDLKDLVAWVFKNFKDPTT